MAEPDDGKATLSTTRRALMLRSVLCAVCVLLMAVAGWWVDRGATGSHVDRLLRWSFVVFAVGLGELFILLVSLCVLGRIDLAKIFEDKDDLVDSPDDKDSRFLRAVAGRGPVSLSRLQALLWTLIVMITYFYRAVTYAGDGLPPIPSELLLVMGISSAVYLTSKQIARTNPLKNKGDGADGGGGPA